MAKNLFPYNLAVTAIFKDEARYLDEWLNYHLLAGVEHFYLYDNGSTDDFAQVLAPYVEKNLVTLTNFPGRMMQYPAYDDALQKYRFHCRYMAFIDLDEFIYPKYRGGHQSLRLPMKFFRGIQKLQLWELTGNTSARTVTKRRITVAASWRDSRAVLRAIGTSFFPKPK